MGDTTRTLKVGDPAPDFELRGTGGTVFRLRDYRGKNVILAFFPAAFSPVCSNQMGRIQQEKAGFPPDTVVAGISVDNVWALDAFAKQMGLDFPVLSDAYPHGAVAEKYGVLMPSGAAERAVVGIDKEGVVRYIDVHQITEVPELGACAAALEG